MERSEVDFDKIARFIQEVLSLKNVPRSGWLKAGIRSPESVAEHSMVSGVISFILAFLETSDFDLAAKAAFIAMIHDLPETRTTDLHKLARKYVSVRSERAFEDQLDLLPEVLSLEIEKARNEVKVFVEDADKLELLFQANEYAKSFSEVMEYVRNVRLKTESASRIQKALKKLEKSWWIYFEEGGDD